MTTIARTAALPADALIYGILEAVAAHRDESVTDLPPLTEHVDADALAQLLVRSPTPVVVEFTAYGCHITVDSDGSLAISDGSRGGIFGQGR